MPDIAVSLELVLDLLVEKVDIFLQQETSLEKKVHDGVKIIEDLLEQMQIRDIAYLTLEVCYYLVLNGYPHF